MCEVMWLGPKEICSEYYQCLAVDFGFVWFHGISAIVGHLMPNPFYTYIFNI